MYAWLLKSQPVAIILNAGEVKQKVDYFEAILCEQLSTNITSPNYLSSNRPRTGSKRKQNKSPAVTNSPQRTGAPHKKKSKKPNEEEEHNDRINEMEYNFMPALSPKTIETNRKLFETAPK